MKKSLLTLLLAGILTVGGTVIAFADDIAQRFNCEENGTMGVQNLMQEGLSFEEAKEKKLNEKFERVDTAVENGVITNERGEEIKNEMKNDSEACTTPGERKAEHEGYGLNQGGNGNRQCNNSGNCSGNRNNKGNRTCRNN